MAVFDDKKQKIPPIGGGAQVNFDNPIPGQITADTFQQPAPANLQPKPRAHPLGGFSNPKARPAAEVPPIGETPMLASHTPGRALPGALPQPIANPAAESYSPDPARIDRMRKPLSTAAATVPSIGSTEPKSGGTISVEGGGSASIDSQGNINRGPGWERGTGSVSVIPSSPVQGGVPPIGGGDKWSFLEDGSAIGAAKAGVARKLGYVPVDYDSNPGKYDAMIAAQGADFARVDKALPITEIGAGADRYKADKALEAQRLSSDTALKVAEIETGGKLAEVRRKMAEDGVKDRKEMEKTFYDSLKDLALPPGYEGKHMELAKILAQDQDPNVDLGIYHSPGSNRQGIAAKKSVFEPILARYRQAGYPEADAQANAYRDLLELEKQKGVSLHQPFPNLDRLFKNDRKKPDELLAAGG